jgi:molybdenum cofactor guanylyltransferase
MMLQMGGVVLCGGASRRMGRPKALLPFAGETLLARVVRLLKTSLDPVVVVAAPGQEIPPLPSDVRIERDLAKGMGPLQGIVVGLESLKGQVDAAYVSGCDMPFLRPNFIQRLTDLLGDQCICVPRVNGRYHPLAGLYRVDILPTARNHLEKQCLRMTFLFESVPTRVVSASELADIDPDLRSLRNLNSPEDYAAALQDLDQKQ